jgi:beta-phosphoglucomutase
MSLKKFFLGKKAVIFDMDGTIIDNIEYHNEARLLFLKKHGAQITREELKAAPEMSTKNLVRKYINPQLTPQEIKALDQEKQEIYRSIYKNNIKEIGGFTDILKLAREYNLKIGLATMGCRENIDMVINALDVTPFFDVIISGDDVEKGKPAPDIYLQALSLLKTEPEEAIVFEDTQKGVIAAKEAGIDVIGIRTSHTPSEFAGWGTLNSYKNYIEFSLDAKFQQENYTKFTSIN